MTRWIGLGGLAGALAFSAMARADAPIRFEEVYSLVRSNLSGSSETELNNLNKAAALELIEKLQGRVELGDGSAPAANSSASIAKTNSFDGGLAYVRLARVGSGAASQIADFIKAVPKTKGVVIDLRFAKGDDYAAAVEVVNLFLGSEHPVLKWSDTIGKTAVRNDVIDLPVAVLVNRQTSGAAEALAAALRDQSLAILIGRPTAGQANVFDSFPLSNGQKLKIARSKVELPNGKAIGPEGLTPDTTVEVDEKNERRWLENPYLIIARPSVAEGPAPFLTSVTNRLGRRMNAAEVGRRHMEELQEDASGGRAPGPSAPAKPQVVQDAALARALDFLKGLNVARERDARGK